MAVAVLPAFRSLRAQPAARPLAQPISTFALNSFHFSLMEQAACQALVSARCWALNRRAFMRLPHSFMSHHLRVWFLLVSRNSHRQSCFAQARNILSLS